MTQAALKSLVLLFAVLAGPAEAQDVLRTATPELLVRALNPAVAQREKTRGLKITGAKQVASVNSYGDMLAATVNLAVHFPFGSAELTPQAQRLLDSLGTGLQSSDLSAYRFLIGGHTDGAGTDSDTLELSRARAAATTQYLVARYGIDPKRLTVSAFGETALLFPDAR